MKLPVWTAFLVAGLAGPASAQSFYDDWPLGVSQFVVEDLEFVAPTQMMDADGAPMALCYQTRGYQILGYDITNDITGYALAADDCNGQKIKDISPAEIETAQGLGFIDPSIPTVAQNSLERNLRTYGVLSVVALVLLFFISSLLRALLGLNPNAPMRKKAAGKVLNAMCLAAKCDGLVSAQESKFIAETVTRLTKHTYSENEIMRIADRVHVNLTEQDFIEFGRGLRDREKDVMLKGVLYTTMAGDRMLPIEYEFATNLAHGLGIPAEDFRRVMYDALSEHDRAPAHV